MRTDAQAARDLEAHETIIALREELEQKEKHLQTVERMLLEGDVWTARLERLIFDDIYGRLKGKDEVVHAKEMVLVADIIRKGR